MSTCLTSPEVEQFKIWGVLSKRDQHVLLHSLTGPQLNQFFLMIGPLLAFFYASDCAVFLLGICKEPLGRCWCILFGERTAARSPTLKASGGVTERPPVQGRAFPAIV